MSKEIQEKLVNKCNEIALMLCRKNEAYGDSAFKTDSQVFSKLGVLEAIDIRMDDKLARIKNGKADALGEDSYLDLAGYLIIRLVNMDLMKNPEEAPSSYRPAMGMNGDGLLVPIVEPGKFVMMTAPYAAEDIKKGEPCCIPPDGMVHKAHI